MLNTVTKHFQVKQADKFGSRAVFQCSDGNSAQENSSLKRVAVVEDFFDIIYAMHVEMGADPGRAPKHAGQKKTYKAVSESCNTRARQIGFQQGRYLRKRLTTTLAHGFLLRDLSLYCHQLARAVFTSIVSAMWLFARQ